MQWRLGVASLVLTSAATNLPAVTIVQNDNLQWSATSTPFGRENYGLTIWQDAARTDYTATFFLYDGSSIEATNYLTDEATDVYVVRAGDRFGPEQIAAGLFPPLFNVTSGFHPAVSVGAGVDFYLGLATSRYQTGVSPRTVYGWAHLVPGAALAMTENVMSYDSPGIIVGTATIVPEPAFLSTTCVAWLITCRRR